MDYETSSVFNTIGIDEKAGAVYQALLSLGPSPVRRIAAQAKVNRGTTHQLLKSLIDKGLVSYYHKQKRQYFVAENPERLLSVAEQRLDELSRAKKQIEHLLPQWQALPGRHTNPTIVRSYEGRQGVRSVLEEVLDVMGREQELLYRAYSSSSIRENLHRCFPSFTSERIKRGIRVKVIAIGAGGEHQELSERRWLPTEQHAPTYRLIYGKRIAAISQCQDTEDLHAVVIEDGATAQTEVILFDQLWIMLQ